MSENKTPLTGSNSYENTFAENTFERLFQSFIDFSIPTFKNASSLTSLIKLTDEIEELKEAGILGNTDEIKDEYTDCFMCLLDSAARAGISIIDLKIAFSKKLAINKNRKWVKNENNTYSHQ